jgi:hypothetical protein
LPLRNSLWLGRTSAQSQHHRRQQQQSHDSTMSNSMPTGLTPEMGSIFTPCKRTGTSPPAPTMWAVALMQHSSVANDQHFIWRSQRAGPSISNRPTTEILVVGQFDCSPTRCTHALVRSPREGFASATPKPTPDGAPCHEIAGNDNEQHAAVSNYRDQHEQYSRNQYRERDYRQPQSGFLD